MSRFRTRWLALLGAMLLLGLSVSSAFGAHPQHPDNRGNQVSSFVHELIFGTDEDPEQEEELEEEEDLEEEELDEEVEVEVVNGDSSHGQCVREVAMSLETGGLNDNHGGAVSFAAKVTCWEPDDEEELTDEDLVEEDETGGTELTTSDGPGKAAAAHERAPGKNKVQGQAQGHGNGRGQGRGRP